MMQLTEEQRKALINAAIEEIEALKLLIANNKKTGNIFMVPGYESQLQRQEIALAALTAKPVAWRWEKNNGLYFEGIKPIGVDSQPLYATAPVSPNGWTCNLDADAALVMLDRIDTLDEADDVRIKDVKRIIGKLAAAQEKPQ